MSVQHEPTLTDRIPEAPQLRLEKVREVRLRDLAIRFFAVVAALALPSLPGSISLLLASGAWVLVALGGYAIVWR